MTNGIFRIENFDYLLSHTLNNNTDTVDHWLSEQSLANCEDGLLTVYTIDL